VGEARWPIANPKQEKEIQIMRKLLALATVLVAAIAFPAAASAAVAPGTYTPTSGSFNSANAPGSSHLTSGTPSCTVNAALDVNCSAYVLGGVGHTNATVNLAANYTAIVDCFNKGTNPQNPVESHTTTFAATSMATVASTKNGQLSVPAQSVSAGQVGQVCPNPNWTPQIRPGSLQLLDFTYTLTFAGFSSPYITITA
jgi:hypothetical protein